MKNQIIQAYEQKKFAERTELPKFRPGDTVEVDYEIKEGSSDKGKARVQTFSGVVIRFKKGTVDASFTVRKVGANGIGVERVFPLYSPNIKAVRLMASGIVRQSRLFYLRERSGKSARIRSRFIAPSKKKSSNG